MDSLDSESTVSDFYVPDKLFEDDQVTLYNDFRMDVLEDQAEPESRPTYIQEILSGKRRLVSICQPRFPSLSSITLTPILTPIQRISVHHKCTNTHGVVAHCRRRRQKLEAINEQLQSEMIAKVSIRYNVVLVCSLLKVYRCKGLRSHM